mmetsp:Transcript_22229/g.71520  ORF Transcript_22229/g.71520 Transcript_22229/m.71520 type:complete len:279 (+) Transcript_22229:1617-2453(+)
MRHAGSKRPQLLQGEVTRRTRRTRTVQVGWIWKMRLTRRRRRSLNLQPERGDALLLARRRRLSSAASQCWTRLVPRRALTWRPECTPGPRARLCPCLGTMRTREAALQLLPSRPRVRVPRQLRRVAVRQRSARRRLCQKTTRTTRMTREPRRKQRLDVGADARVGARRPAKRPRRLVALAPARPVQPRQHPSADAVIRWAPMRSLEAWRKRRKRRATTPRARRRSPMRSKQRASLPLAVRACAPRVLQLARASSGSRSQVWANLRQLPLPHRRPMGRN